MFELGMVDRASEFEFLLAAVLTARVGSDHECGSEFEFGRLAEW